MERRGEKSLQECLRLEVYCLCWGVIRFTVFVCTYVNSLTRPSLCCPAPYISKEHEDENKGYFGPGPGQYEVTGQKYQVGILCFSTFLILILTHVCNSQHPLSSHLSVCCDYIRLLAAFIFPTSLSSSSLSLSFLPVLLPLFFLLRSN
mmetsp:Transcript_18351/g.46002  ORF Transcript_18351/g.46002 Transcript_18351/m.46002 type:complete len:148 (+) Transcript_18351:1575-2018(+)